MVRACNFFLVICSFRIRRLHSPQINLVIAYIFIYFCLFFIFVLHCSTSLKAKMPYFNTGKQSSQNLPGDPSKAPSDRENPRETDSIPISPVRAGYFAVNRPGSFYDRPEFMSMADIYMRSHILERRLQIVRSLLNLPSGNF